MKHVHCCILLISALTLVTFGRAVANEFTIWDDPHTITKNASMNPPTLRSALNYFREPAGGLYVPVTYLAWSALAGLSYAMSKQLSAPLFHGASMAAHAAAAVVVFMLLSELIRAVRSSIEDHAINIAACAGAILFALHPCQVEAVAWASGLKDVLAGFFSLLSILLYVRFANSRRWGFYVWATLALILALLSKPGAVVVPAMCLAIDWAILKRPTRDVVRSLAPWFILAIPVLIVGRLAQETANDSPPSIALRPLIATDALAFYLGTIIAPINLGVDYGRFPGAVIASGSLYYSWLIPLALAGLLAWSRDRLLMVGGALFVIALLPVLGFTPFQFQFYSTNADHYLYLPMVGISLFAAAILVRWSRAAIPFAAAIAAIMMIGSIIQVGYWKTSETLFQHALDVNPRSALANKNVAFFLASKGDFAGAIPHLEMTLKFVPKDADVADVHREIAQCYANTGDLARAIAHLEQSLSLSEAQGNASPFDHVLVAKMLLHENRAAEALPHLERALQLEPTNAEAAALLAKVRGGKR